MVQLLVPTTVKQLDDVRDLMRAFIAWHRQRHQQDLALIDAYFDAAAFEAELAGLPGKYAPPRAGCCLPRSPTSRPDVWRFARSTARAVGHEHPASRGAGALSAAGVP